MSRELETSQPYVADEVRARDQSQEKEVLPEVPADLIILLGVNDFAALSPMMVLTSHSFRSRCRS